MTGDSVQAEPESFAPARDGRLTHGGPRRADGSRVFCHPDSPAYVIRRLWQRRAQLWQDVAPGDLTFPQFMVLAVLSEHGQMDQRTLGSHTRLDKSTAGPLINRLHANGLIDVAQDPADRRRKVLGLTDEGQKALAVTAPYATVVEDMLLAPLSSAQQADFLALATRILNAEDGDV
ncbi:MarR family winged helix-turn-helix transcriptional regulator [Streptomyces sp. NPDC086082]|uniref:MarR family winged helix-turn-helix transcriptional regulator n=1 Tax=Streptomyces sp. NPDC086082 TaxID=3365750 RepID=UPI0037F78240